MKYVFFGKKYQNMYIIGFSLIRSEPFSLHVPNDSIAFSGMYLPSLEETN